MFLQKSDYNKRKNRSGGIIMAILVTGGAGYIGSHTVVELQNAGYDVVVLDNLSNASEKALDRVSKITGKPVKFYKADILDRDALNNIFDKETIESCIHFAGLKAVGESVVKPWEYYENNIAGTLTLVDVMRKHNVKNIIFSSSATVYGDPAQIPITEECQRDSVRIRMAGQNPCWNRCLPISRKQIQNGMLCFFVTLIQLAHIRVEQLERTQMAFPITLCHILHR